MLTSNTLSEIVEIESNGLPYTIEKRVRAPVEKIGLMTTFSFKHPVEYQIKNVRLERKTKLIGILFCHPRTPFCKEEIIEHLSYFNSRTRNSVDFFCAGYLPANAAQYGVDNGGVAVRGDLNWVFDENVYVKLIEEFEAKTSWKYSGETDLILTCISKNEANGVEMHFEKAIVCNLEQMKRDKAFDSVRMFFEKIFRFSREATDKDLLLEFSDERGLEAVRHSIRESILSMLPESLRGLYKSGKHYAVTSIAKK